MLANFGYWCDANFKLFCFSTGNSLKLKSNQIKKQQTINSKRHVNINENIYEYNIVS